MPTAVLKLGAVEVWIAGNEYLLTGYKSWVEFKLKWPLKDAGNVALVASATVMPPQWLPSLMARDATKLMEEAAQKTADDAERARQTAADNVTKDETELARLEQLPETRDSVRWDRSTRDHTEPLDNYKPEGWEWDRVYPDVYRVYPDVYSPFNNRETEGIRLKLVPRNGPIRSFGMSLTSDEVDLSAGVLRPSTHGNSFYQRSFALNYLPIPLAPYRALAPPVNSDLQVVNGNIGSVIIEMGYPLDASHHNICRAHQVQVATR